MINIKNLRDDIDTVASVLATRGYELNKAIFIELEGERKVLQVEVKGFFVTGHTRKDEYLFVRYSEYSS